MPLVEDRKLEKRRAILQAARDCFVLHGFHSTGMAEICQAASMSPGNLYRYFPGKSAIIKTIVDDTRRQVMPVYEKLQKHPNPVEGIVEIILHSFRQLRDPSESRLWIEIVAEASRDEAIRRSCQLFDRQMRAILKKLLRSGVKSGRIAPGLDLEATTLWLIALVDGAIVRDATGPRVNPEPAMQALARSIRRMVCAPGV